MRRILQFVIPIVVAMVAAPPAFAATKVALVIGNSNYTSVGLLPNPTNDAKAVAESFGRMGFEVIYRENLDFSGMRSALQEFEQAVIGSEIAAVFYAGHGIEMGGQNYLIPVDARLQRDTHVGDESVPLSRVLSAVQPATKLRIVLLDACRNNPFAAFMQTTGATRSVPRGLARVEPPEAGTLIAYASSEGTTADDGNSAHSPFTTALLTSLEEPGLEVRFLFGRVKDEVIARTGGNQTPFVYNSLGGAPVYLLDPPSPVVVAALPSADVPLPVAGQAPPVPAPTAVTDEAEARFWTDIRQSTTSADFEMYLRIWPEGPHADEVRDRLAILTALLANRAAVAEPVAPPPPPVAPVAPVAILPVAPVVVPAPPPQQVAVLAPAVINVAVLTIDLQTQLNRLGCYPRVSANNADGDWGPGSRNALARFLQHSGVGAVPGSPETNPQGYQTLLASVTQWAPGVCPPVVVAAPRPPQNAGGNRNFVNQQQPPRQQPPRQQVQVQPQPQQPPPQQQQHNPAVDAFIGGVIGGFIGQAIRN